MFMHDKVAPLFLQWALQEKEEKNVLIFNIHVFVLELSLCVVFLVSY